jgi:DNA repair ATPase RecN
MSIQDLRVRLEREKGRFAQVERDIFLSQDLLSNLQTRGINIEQSAIILQIVSQQTQSQLSFYISDMVTAAIETVFHDDGFQFFLEFVQRRGKTEADLFLSNVNGNRIKPSDAEGGGLIDIVSFALRICLWSLTKSSRAVMVLDEPLKFLSRDLLPKAGELIKSLSEKLNLQIIMVSHLDELIDEADKEIQIKKIKGISTII